MALVKVVEDVWCPSCGAHPGGLCVTTSGKVKNTPHAARVKRADPDTPRQQRKPGQTLKRGTPPAVKRAVILRSGGWCEVCPIMDPHAPQHRGDDPHHRRMRSQGGADTKENIYWICRRMHRLVHDHGPTTKRAYELGVLLRTGDE